MRVRAMQEANNELFVLIIKLKF